MKASQWIVAIAVGLGLALVPASSWAVGCCKCTGCPTPPAIFCTTSAGDSGDCFETCDQCGDFDFDAAATCGVGAFADCLASTQGVQAPALDARGIGLAVATLLVAGLGLLARSRRAASRA